MFLSLSACMEPKSVLCSSGRACPAGQKCAASQDVCIKTACGDGILQAGETCDDGNILDGDGCSHTCESAEACGNGLVDSAAGEVCDDGNSRDGDGCSANCRSNEKCGNLVVDLSVGEKCDDGDTRSGDGCSADCLSNESCGNNYPDSVIGEVCDDGNRESGDGCSADCHSGEVCGNKILDRGEACDDGNAGNNADCLSDCTLARCGDGYLNELGTRPEECDAGGESPDCDANCTRPVCGDGIVNVSAKEQCDDGNDRNDDGCLANCTVARCGDGYVNAGVEQCDDGNAGVCGTCGAQCTWREVAKAKGSIAVVEAGLMEDGEVFSISDGWPKSTGGPRSNGSLNRVFFEFDRDGHVSHSHRAIGLKEGASAGDIAKAIVDAIEDSNLDVRVEVGDAANSVSLSHRAVGSFANQPIIQSVAHEDFVVNGMSGGVGYDCPENARCSRDEDCAGKTCRSGRCGTPR